MLKEYLLVGGMPNAIMKYMEYKNYYDAYEVNKALMNDYKSDIVKYIFSNNDKIKCASIYENIPAFLSKENKKYMLSNIDKNARYVNYDIALKSLISTNIVYKIDNLNEFTSPINIHKKGSEFKIYYNNPGFISTIFNLNNEILYNNNDYCNIRGALYENYVLCELIQKIDKKDIAYYSFRDVNNNAYEIDFCVEDEIGKLIPIEVKSSKDFNTKSLNKLTKNKDIKYSLILSFKNFGYDENKKAYKIPLYALGFLNFENNRIKLNTKK